MWHRQIQWLPMCGAKARIAAGWGSWTTTTSHCPSRRRALARCAAGTRTAGVVRSTAIPCRPLWIFLSPRRSARLLRSPATRLRCPDPAPGDERREQLGHAAAGGRRAQLEHPQAPERACEFTHLGHDLVAGEASVVLERLPLQAHPPGTGGRLPPSVRRARGPAAEAGSGSVIAVRPSRAGSMPGEPRASHPCARPPPRAPGQLFVRPRKLHPEPPSGEQVGPAPSLQVFEPRRQPRAVRPSNGSDPIRAGSPQCPSGLSPTPWAAPTPMFVGRVE